MFSAAIRIDVYMGGSILQAASMGGKFIICCVVTCHIQGRASNFLCSVTAEVCPHKRYVYLLCKKNRKSFLPSCQIYTDDKAAGFISHSVRVNFAAAVVGRQSYTSTFDEPVTKLIRTRWREGRGIQEKGRASC